jgi:hypothetical protein
MYRKAVFSWGYVEAESDGDFGMPYSANGPIERPKTLIGRKRRPSFAAQH